MRFKTGDEMRDARAQVPGEEEALGGQEVAFPPAEPRPSPHGTLCSSSSITVR